MSDTALDRYFADESESETFAQQFAPALRDGGVIYLHGDLGAGKTTLARAMLRALGVGERIKSPTYSLVESYNVGALPIHHLDLYRIADPGELEWLGLADLADGLLLVEWPDRGQGALPTADLHVHLAYAEPGRRLHAVAASVRGGAWIEALDRQKPADGPPVAGAS